MLKIALYPVLLAGLLAATSGCCGFSNWLHGGSLCQGGCGSSDSCGVGSCGIAGRWAAWHTRPRLADCDSCTAPVTREACGGCGGGCFGLFDLFGWGCGDVYYGDWLTPYDRCEPCDNHGNWIGRGYYPTAGPAYRSAPGVPRTAPTPPVAPEVSGEPTMEEIRQMLPPDATNVTVREGGTRTPRTARR